MPIARFSSTASAGIIQPDTAWSVDAVSSTFTGKAALVLCASLFVAVCAHLSVPLPFTPVPLTLSDLAVLIVGLILGPRMGFTALGIYLAEGAGGLPVFSPAGPGGFAQLLGATGGYLIAYPFAAAIAGYLARSLKAIPAYMAALTAATAGSTLLMASGAAWLGFYLHHDAALTLKLAVLPFLPGQVVKIIASAGIHTSLRRWSRA